MYKSKYILYGLFYILYSYAHILLFPHISLASTKLIHASTKYTVKIHYSSLNTHFTTSCSCSRCCFSSSKRSLFLASSARRCDTWRPTGGVGDNSGLFTPPHTAKYITSSSLSLTHTHKTTSPSAPHKHAQMCLCQDTHRASGQTFPHTATTPPQLRHTSSEVINDVRGLLNCASDD